MLAASMIQASLWPPFGSYGSPREKIASLPAPPAAQPPGSPFRLPDQELFADEIRDTVMPRGPLCPKCGGREVVRFGKRNGVQRYRCKACTRTFTDLTGTVLHGLRRRDLWLGFCRCLMEGLSVRETAAELGIAKNTAFAWRHRTIAAFAAADSAAMCEGIVELAQWPVLRSFKGSRVPEEARMDGLKSSVRRYHCVYGDVIPRSRQLTLVVSVDRAGAVRAAVAQRREILTPTLKTIVKSDAEVCCAPRLGRRFRFGGGWPGGVRWVGASGEASGREKGGPLYHVRNANRFIHLFIEWMRRFCGVATKYLLRYFAWFLRWALLAAVSPLVAAKALLLEALGHGRRTLREAG